MSQTNFYDVIIVGGGFMGTASAFFLSQRGIKVGLFEQNRIGQYASGVNFGNVRRQGRHLDQLELANRSRDLWGKLPQLIGDDLEFIQSGHMRIGYEEQVIQQFEDYANDPRAQALKLEVLTGKALHDRFPYLGKDVLVGSYAPLDGHANPRLVSPAFARVAKKLGADIYEHCEISRVAKNEHGFTVQTKEGVIYHCHQLLITAGAWAQRLSNQFGESVPLFTRGPQMTVTEPLPYRFKTVIGVSSPNEMDSIYFRQIPRGNIIIGGCHRTIPDMDARKARFEPQAMIYQMQQLHRIVPELSNIHIIRSWSGIESYLPDSLPIMGPSSTTEGLYYAFGFCGHGFQLGPAVGDVMAELIATGETSTYIEPFDIQRFLPQPAKRIA
ncbi:NAD(P)/FAD-dependent oxidoreductase [Vibrio nitrifigilis]|uniref:FAD-binding oxidoreductase n=1 Tax=Vibrio nitrifigilis TaxID=2789781 RepID=A0ABS0GIZ5_9VIBR|nr:FAD-binding oxidoreductase [Vibrio nitrifigilis]MBF9002260.1 FAD-binding oxidoreductase [Vibrio nitrifigilis]